MQRTLVRDVGEHVGEVVTVQGFAQTVRDQKRVQFIVLRDHTGMVQVVIERSEEYARFNELVANLARESAVQVTGLVVADPHIRLGGLEIRLQDLQVVSLADPVLPIDLSERTTTMIDKRLDWRFLDLRRPESLAIFQVQTTAEHAMREFWLSEGFIEIHTPKLMGVPSESGAELFELAYFGETAYLAQSPQFYKQMAMAAGFDRVFEIGPAFRADPSFTPRHATEFTSVDVEMSWIESHEDVMALEERWLQYVLQAVQAKHGEQVRELLGAEIRVPTLPFPRFTMAQAQEILRREGHVPPPGSKEGDLDPQAERVLSDYVRREYDHEFVFVTDYSFAVRPFYHMRYGDRPDTTKSFDLLWKGVEITTGAQREHRYEVLVEQAQEKGLNLEPLQFYLNFFRYGCPPHGGYGFGLVRMLMLMLNQDSIREVTFIHRGPTRLMP
ncbi:MAG: aspartate--tRNA(Asn) ligase [Chloroflexi bacterium]|jgi:nondiscriminating aspartyl-tRNA synthetase|nr:aspartate--tRNA(Asn) ligase [Chloroflexota bacterium]